MKRAKTVSTPERGKRISSFSSSSTRDLFDLEHRLRPPVAVAPVSSSSQPADELAEGASDRGRRWGRGAVVARGAAPTGAGGRRPCGRWWC